MMVTATPLLFTFTMCSAGRFRGYRFSFLAVTNRSLLVWAWLRFQEREVMGILSICMCVPCLFNRLLAPLYLDVLRCTFSICFAVDNIQCYNFYFHNRSSKFLSVSTI